MGYIREGLLSEGYLRLRFGGLISGGAFIEILRNFRCKFNSNMRNLEINEISIFVSFRGFLSVLTISVIQ